MTGNKILLDTNIIIELFRGNQEITNFLAHEILLSIPPPVVGELYVGAYKSANPLKHIKQVNDFLIRCQILSIDGKTAHEYANIKSALLKKGKPIPENDIWIAATSQQYGIYLHTRDKHFIEIDNLLIKFW